MKKDSLKLNVLVNSELKLAEQSMIKGGQSAPPSEGDKTACSCVTVIEGEHKGSTKKEAYSKKHGAPA